MFAVAAPLCIVDCLGASLASSFQCQEHRHPQLSQPKDSYDNQKMVSGIANVPWVTQLTH